MKINEITFNKLFQQIVYKLKTLYSKANETFTLASPSGQILTVITELFQTNMLYIQNVQNSFDLNSPINSVNDKLMRTMAKIGQYNPSRSSCAFGSIQINTKADSNILDSINGNVIIFRDKMKLKNSRNNLDYIIDINSDTVTFNLSNNTPIILNVLQGTWRTDLSFTGSGEINQTYIVPQPKGDKDIDNYHFKVFVNGELWQRKQHRFDLLKDEKAYMAYTSFSGGLDIVFGNGNEGLIPELGSIIEVYYLETNGTDGNLLNTQVNEFKFIDFPTDIIGEDIVVDELFNVTIRDEVQFGSNGDNSQFLKSILPYTSNNFVLSGPEQYKFFLMRLGLFSIIDVFTTETTSYDTINKIHKLAQDNLNLFNSINSDDNTSSLKQLVQQNLNEIVLLRKSLLLGTDSLINIFLIPDITLYYGKSVDSNYFNIDESLFIISDIDKQRLLNYLTRDGIQIISNEVNIITPIVKRYVINVNVRLFTDAVEENIINNIISQISTYFVYQMRRDRIPPSDLVRIIDDIDGVDSVTVEFICESNENYHREYLERSQRFQIENKRQPEDSEIIMSDGMVYDRYRSIGLDPILGDILIYKTELPIIRGGFSDRWNNFYNTKPADGLFSSVNVLILPEKSKRKTV